MLALIIGFLPLSGAWAHASLLETSPADGAALSRSPSVITLRFDEDVTPIDLRVVGPAGAVQVTGGTGAGGVSPKGRLPPDLPDGTYLATWRVISADGHPVSGTLVFGVGGAPSAPPSPASGNEQAWDAAGQVLRFLFYTAFVLGAGSALFRAVVEDIAAPTRRAMATAAIVGVLAALLSLSVQGGAMAGAAFPAGLPDPELVRTASTSTVLLRSLTTALGMAIVAAALLGEGRAARLAGLFGALLTAIGLSLSGHAAVGGWVMQALLAAHALVAAYWLGAFLPLLALLAQQGGAALPVVRRFAALAIPAVAILVTSGAVQALSHLARWDALLTTTYGQLVLAKLFGAGLLLTLAALNHLRLTPALPSRGGRALSRSIRAEGVIGLSVLGLTAVLSVTPPHAAPHDDADHGQATHHRAARLEVSATTRVNAWTVHLQVDPGRSGPNRLTLRLDRDGQPAAPFEVWLELSQAEAGVVGLRRPMQPTQPGTFVIEGPELAVPGHWRAHVELLVSDFEQLTADLEFDVAPSP